MHRILRMICWMGLLLSLFTRPIRAQENSRITGKITDAVTGEPLIGVAVLGHGRPLAVSGAQGRYTTEKIASDTCMLTFRYIGYQSRVVHGIHLSSQTPTTLDVALKPSAAQALSQVTVMAQYRQASVNALYARQKNNAVQSDGISAQQIRQSPDAHTGAVLKRINGLSVEDQKFVIIRGLGSRYNSTLMNGTVMPSTEPDRQAFAFNAIPANVVDHIVVRKTSSPASPGDAAGGAVDIHTKDFPEKKFLTLTAGTAYQSETSFRSFYSGREARDYDLLGFRDKANALPDAFQRVRRTYANLPVQQKLAVSKAFPATYGSQLKGKAAPPLDLRLAAGNSKTFDNGNRLGYIAAVHYSTDKKIVSGDKADFLLDKEQRYQYQDKRYDQVYRQSALVNIAYQFGPHRLSLKNFYSNTLNHQLIRRTGTLFEGADSHYQLQGLHNQTTQDGLLNTVLSGQHQQIGGKLQIDWSLSYGRSYRYQPDQQIISAFQLSPEDPYTLHLSNSNSPAIKNAGRIYSGLHENIYSGRLDFFWPVLLFGREQKLQLGVNTTRNDRHFNILALGYASALDPYGGGAVVPLGKDPDFNGIFSSDRMDQYKILLAGIPQNTKDYTGEADLHAAYLMADTRFSDRWRLVWGARMEHHQQQLLSAGQAKQDYERTNILPSLNLSWSVPKWILRMAYSRTVNRPLFRELAAFRYYDYEQEFIISGNPDLLPASNDNLDFRAAYYPAAGEVLSFSLFYKNFDHPIEQTNQGNQVLTYNNADRAIDYGMELEIRKRLNFIRSTGLFSHLTFYANASLIKGQVSFDHEEVSRPLQGQSPYLLNGGIHYTTPDERFAFAVSYNRMGQRLQFRGEQEGLDTYEKARDLLDVHISKQLFGKAAQLQLNVSDLLASPHILYYRYGSSDRTRYAPETYKIIATTDNETRISLSFTYHFF